MNTYVYSYSIQPHLGLRVPGRSATSRNSSTTGSHTNTTRTQLPEPASIDQNHQQHHYLRPVWHALCRLRSLVLREECASTQRPWSIMRLDQQSHAMSRSCAFHKIKMWPNLQVGRLAGSSYNRTYAKDEHWLSMMLVTAARHQTRPTRLVPAEKVQASACTCLSAT